MSSLDSHQAFRFVVVYRREPREIVGAESRWRGWLTPVTEAGDRLGFNSLDELPDLIRGWIRSNAAAPSPDRGGDS